MKVAAYKHGFLYQVLIAVLILAAWALYLLNVVSLTAFYLSVVIFAMAAIQPFTAMVVIHENGVQARMFGIKKGAIKWEDMEEVGIGSQNEAGRKYLYFSIYPWIRDKRIRIMRQKQNNRSVWVEATPEVLEEVKKYYKGRILYLKENGLS